MKDWAAKAAQGGLVSLGVRLPQEPPMTPGALRDLEGLHKATEVYNWLSFRFPEVFVERDVSERTQAQCRELINRSLQTQTDVTVQRAQERAQRQRWREDDARNGD